MHKNHPLRIFGVSAFITLALAAVVLFEGGISALWLYVVLVILEVTFSFDNAVVNSKILVKLSPYWQTMFLTVGIFIAVFVVRFILPVVIVAITTGLNMSEVVNLAFRKPDLYSAELHHAEPLINAFGGTFLVMIGLGYFVDREKDVHWLKRIEHTLAVVGRVQFIKIAVMLVVAVALYFTADPSEPDLRRSIAIASLLGILLHAALDGVSVLFEKKNKNSGKQLVGMAAFASFMYLQVLDASFSFDGVIGAFAITTSVLLIIAGLGAGAIWVRSMTVYLVRRGTLAKYKYLEHGAHWAILALGVVMIVKLYGIEPTEWFTGSLGLVFIVAAVVSSVLERSVSAKSAK